MSADRIEVAQQHGLQARIRDRLVAKDLLADHLGVAVRGIGVAIRRCFGDGHPVRLPIDRAGGGEDQPVHAVLLHQLQQHAE
jgi:hypothetical protein